MFTRSKLFELFTRAPHKGGRKDHPMPDVQTSPKTPQQPATAAAPAAGPTAAPPTAPEGRDEVARQLTTLTEAMRQLAESHKTLLDAVKAQPSAPSAPPTPAPATPATPTPAQPVDIGGDPAGGGHRPGALVDYSRLSPVQQITLGLKDPATRPVTRTGAD